MDGRGWGFVMRDPDGEFLLARVQQGEKSSGSLIEKVNACLKGLQVAKGVQLT